MPSNLQWDTHGQQLAMYRGLEESYRRILSLGAGGRGRSPSIYRERAMERERKGKREKGRKREREKETKREREKERKRGIERDVA